MIVKPAIVDVFLMSALIVKAPFVARSSLARRLLGRECFGLCQLLDI
jgi:hypothetical protein